MYITALSHDRDPAPCLRLPVTSHIPSTTTTAFTITRILDCITQLITTYTSIYTGRYCYHSTEAAMTHSPPPFRLTVRTKWTVDVVEKILAAADASSEHATVSVLGRPGMLREAREVFYALPEAQVDGMAHPWSFTMIDMRTGIGRLFVIADSPSDHRYAIRPPRRTRAQGHSNAFELTLLPPELGALPAHIVMCVVIIWLTRADAVTRVASVDRLRINEGHVLPELNALLRGVEWVGKSIYIEGVPKRTLRSDTNVRCSKRARR